MDFDDFDEDARPFDRVYIYIAMSDDLQQWAHDHDRLYLAKIGYSGDPEGRLAYLNGESLRGGIHVRPCLNFTDWRIIGKWRIGRYGSAKITEGRLKQVFSRLFEPFDRTEIVKRAPPGNGETEIYRIHLTRLPVLPGFFRVHGAEGHLVNQAVEITERVVEEIQEWQRQLRFLESEDDDFE